ncbi:hypothetical protein [Halorhodospira neutriphila]|uniref:Nitroreductase domain-containing protein n=1 Tax=Halorhodospira neutriphila TaxID=168379 RepID=A0ABS1E5X8_9GAMM|nr:hypothetical protein [Halorhodospira neutriphila]MBK1726602.1 hypothetical protein [Halorhodospira neutriphila]
MGGEAELPAVVRALVEAGRAAPSADNSQPWAFEWDGQRLRVRAREAGGFPPDAHATLLSVGAVLENLEQAAAALGVALTCEPGGEPGVHAQIPLDPAAAAGPLDPEAPLFQRHTNRLPTRPEVPDGAILEALEAGEPASGPAVRVITDPETLRGLAEAVALASAIRFRVPELHRALMGSLRLGEAEARRGDGLDVATLGLPPGGAALLRWLRPWPRMRRLNRLGLYRLLAWPDGRRIRSAPAVAVVSGGSGDPVAAGRLMERAWIRACQHGLAVHPYYAVTDQLQRLHRRQLPAPLEAPARRLEERVGQLALAGGVPDLLLRLGWPRREPVRSQRLPLGALTAPR